MTASLRLRDIGVEFPIYTGGSRSLKKVLFNRSTQGNLARDGVSNTEIGTGLFIRPAPSSTTCTRSPHTTNWA